MFKKFIVLVCLINLSFFYGGSLYAQDDLNPKVEEIPSEIKAVAGHDKNVIVDRQTSFSALGSVVTAVKDVKYTWDFGDGSTASGVEVVHVYRNSGVYRVKLQVEAKSLNNKTVLQSEDEIIVNVDEDLIVLLSDESVSAEDLKYLQEKASTQGVLIVNIQVSQSEVDYLIERELAQKIIENRQDIIQAGSVIIWTDRNIGLNGFLEAAQILGRTSEGNGSNLQQFGFNNKVFVVLTDQNFNATAKFAQSVYNLVEPQYILLSDESAKETVFSGVDAELIMNQLRSQDIDYRLVGLHTQREVNNLRPWNFMSFFIGFMVDKGVPINTIYLILILPLIATVIAFTRQVVGIKALGIYTPSIIAVSFLVTGLKYGLLIFIVTLLIGTLGRLVARKIRLAYLPRMANVLIIVCLAIFSIFLLGSYFEKAGLIEISIFPILIMVLLTEKFITAQIERGNRAAVALILETLFLSIICFWLANWQVLRTFILAYPEYIFLTIFMNYLIGKWTGLRLIEYYRFRKVIKNVELAEKK